MCVLTLAVTIALGMRTVRKGVREKKEDDDTPPAVTGKVEPSGDPVTQGVEGMPAFEAGGDESLRVAGDETARPTPVGGGTHRLQVQVPELREWCAHRGRGLQRR